MSRPVLTPFRRTYLVDADIGSSWTVGTHASPPGDCVAYIECTTNPSSLTAFTFQIWGSYDGGTTLIPLDTITKGEYTSGASDYYYQVTLPAFPLLVFSLIQIAGAGTPGIKTTIFVRS